MDGMITAFLMIIICSYDAFNAKISRVMKVCGVLGMWLRNGGIWALLGFAGVDLGERGKRVTPVGLHFYGNTLVW